jgi:hypothetical protein
MPDNEKVVTSHPSNVTKDRTDAKRKEAERRVQDALEDDEVRINLERMHERDKGG